MRTESSPSTGAAADHPGECLLDTALRRSLLLLCIGSIAMCASTGVWYWVMPGSMEPASAAAQTLSLNIVLSEIWRLEFAYAVAVAAVGGLLNGFTGFGSSLVMIPLLTFLYGPAEAVAVGIGLAALGYVLLLPDAIRDADWPDVIPACLMGFVFVPIGIILLLTTDPDITRRLMGGSVILVALIMIRGWNYNGPRNKLTSAAAGSFTGFTSGFFGMGAAGATIYYLSGDIRAAVQRANILVVLGVMAALAVIGVSLGGGADLGSLILGIALILPFALPTWAGALLFRRASNEVYRQVCLWLLIIMGCAVIVL